MSLAPVMSVHTGEHPQAADTIRVVVLSDTHTQAKKLTVPPGDILLHCGDICRKGGSPQQIQDFNEFLQMQRHAAKVVIAGNHDFCFDHDNFSTLKAFHHYMPADYHPIDPHSAMSAACYLQDQGTIIFGYKVWGSPWIPKHSPTAFSITRDSPMMAAKREQIPSDTEILMTHCPPQGILDFTRKGGHEGCLLLAEHIRRVNPIVHVFGHVHEGYGSTRIRDTLFVNAANVTNTYKCVNRPLVFDLPRKLEIYDH